MNLKYILLTAIAIFLFDVCSAQVLNRDITKKWRSPDGRNISLFYVSDNLNPEEIPNLEIVGSPYINEDFQESFIYTYDGQVHGGLVMRYNAYLDIMEFKEFLSDHDSLINYIEKTPDLIFNIGKQVYDFIPYYDNLEKGTYMELLLRGVTVDLYKKTNKKYIEARIARTSFEIDYPRRFQDIHSYFFVSPEDNFFELKGSKKIILNTIQLKKVELQQYIRLHKLNLDLESDLLKLIIYLDSLL
jgi:hypothetical protein